MRKEVNDLLYKVFTYQKTDRLPDIEFGYWPQTIRRWLREGMPIELTKEEQNQCFLPKLDRFFGFDQDGTIGNDSRMHMNPVFDEKILDRSGDIVTVQDYTGCIAQRYPSESEDSSIPHYIKFPVENPDDWKGMKERFRLDDPTRARPESEIVKLRRERAEGKCVSIGFCGFYGQLRNWMGMENLSMAFYDYPEMIHDMVEHWAELCALQIESLPEDIPIDFVSW